MKERCLWRSWTISPNPKMQIGLTGTIFVVVVCFAFMNFVVVVSHWCIWHKTVCLVYATTLFQLPLLGKTTLICSKAVSKVSVFFTVCLSPLFASVCVCVCSLFWAKPPSRLVCSKAVSRVSVCKWCGYVRVCVHACVCVHICVCVHAYVRACVRLKGTLHSHFTWKMGQYTTVVCYFHRVLWVYMQSKHVAQQALFLFY